MDAWKDEQLQAMSLGGNARFRRFMEEQGIASLSLVEKYNSKAAGEYRNALKQASAQAVADARMSEAAAQDASATKPAVAVAKDVAPAAQGATSPGERESRLPSSNVQGVPAASQLLQSTPTEPLCTQKASPKVATVDVWSDELWA
jgi:crotonobetainyl-CoA:carnitine CoA-transferase CaiB-like acyl-CoA transferase